MPEENLTKKEIYDLQKSEKIKELQAGQKRRQLKRFFLWGSVAVLIGVSFWGLGKISGTSAPANPAEEKASVVNAILGDDWTQGNKDAKTALLEYSDFQCPACGVYHPLVKKLIAEHGGEIKFVYKHFPLPQHANAKNAAYAAEAAGRQNKFWEMHDLIFENQNIWSESRNAKDIFLGYARSLNLDLEQFQKDRDSSAIKQKVEKDYNSGISDRVDSTPTFFLNGKKIQPRNYEDFVNLIKEANA